MSTTQGSLNNSIPSSSSQHNDAAPPQISTQRSQADEVSPSPVQATGNHIAPHSTVAITPSFLSFPDEVILRLFEFLKGFNTGGLFERPRDAFALAQTNTRLLNLFSSNLTRITPDVVDERVSTLDSRHILSVLRLSGEWLREIHIPDNPDSWDILPYLLNHCPQLEELSICSDISFSSLNKRDLNHFLNCVQALIPRLSWLSIFKPDPRVLRFLVPPPSELILKSVSSVCIKMLIPILRDPPKKLQLEFKATESKYKSAFVAALREACPKMEQLILISKYLPHQLATYDVLEEALKVLNVVRENQDSKCKKMTIKGDFTEMFRVAHPSAVLEFALNQALFSNVGNRVYPKVIPLLDQYLTLDLSRLEVVTIPIRGPLNPEWKERLSGMNLSFMQLLNLEEGAALFQKVKVKIVEITTVQMDPGINWGFLKHTKEVRVRDIMIRHMFTEDITDFLTSFGNLLRNFRGECVSVHDFPLLFGISYWNDDQHLPAMRMLVDGMRVFEARGGDAFSIRAWLLHDMSYNEIQ